MCNFHVKVFNSTQNELMINYPKDLIDRSITNITCNMITKDHVWKNLDLQIAQLNSVYFVSTEGISAVMYLYWFNILLWLLILVLFDIFRFFLCNSSEVHVTSSGFSFKSLSGKWKIKSFSLSFTALKTSENFYLIGANF